KRLMPLDPAMCLVVTARRYENESGEELRKTGMKGTILSEPMPRNTAAAVLYAATYLSRVFDDSVMIVLPADHFIKRDEEFASVLRTAVEQAQSGKLVTIGIKPEYPETGYGYIKALKDGGAVKGVDMFVEKPNLETARRYVIEGNYFWNSGIFAWNTSIILEGMKRLMPAHYFAFDPLRKMTAEEIASNGDESWAVKQKIFSAIDSVSIDYGIMEKADNRVVIPADFGWADLGSWNSIDDILKPDESMNRGPEVERMIFIDSRNCSVFTEKSRVALVGLSNLVVVESGNDILIMDKNSSQKVRDVVAIARQRDSKA
ncbi:MAG: mannose-1-phosphate guanylyltransferase, partial [Spirochaetes bacterium]